MKLRFVLRLGFVSPCFCDITVTVYLTRRNAIVVYLFLLLTRPTACVEQLFTNLSVTMLHLSV